MELKSIDLTQRSYSSNKTIGSVMEDLDCPKSPSSAGVKRNRRFAGLTINVRKSKFIPKKKLELDEKYNISEVLGVGAYSCVKAATEISTDRKVAIKTCHGTTGREMLATEYSILKRLDDSRIIKVYDLLHDDASDESHMIMEYFSKTTLHDFVKANGTLTEAETKLVMQQVFNVINYLHENGITHCDIKPENILFNENKEMKLIDFNISRSKCESELSPEDNSDTRSDSAFSANLSSPLYAAPEMKKCRHSQSVDIWGAGIVLFTCLLNTMRSHGLHQIKDLDDRSDEMTKIVKESTEICEPTKDFIFQLLTKESEDRINARDALTHEWLTE